jgi:ABC-type lipoprotein export system ATPase subunit
MNTLFNISQLKCSYDQGKRIVLEIDHLEIPAGKTVFIIGASGIGKSTILETLGLMSFTLHPSGGTSFIFQDPQTGTSHDLPDLWKKSDQIVSEFRNKHFSFIFQNTHLMSNLTAHENVMLTQLIQGKSMDAARARTREMLEVIGLKEIKVNQKINTLSGGQRQRLAFCRAIATDFSVLFGDEPTGNLDITNAHNLMDILKQIISEKQRSAVIVSHDIDLALKYADLIIYIRKQFRSALNSEGIAENEAYGLISAESLYMNVDNDKWMNNNEYLSNAAIKQKLIKDLHHISNLDI